MQVEDPEPEGRLSPRFLGQRLELLADLGRDLFDARRMDAAVLEKPLDGDARDLAAHRVERGQENRAGRVVDDDVDPGGHLEGADVAALAPDDPPLHLVRRQRDEADRGLDGLFEPHTLGRIDHQPARDPFRAFLGFFLDPPRELRGLAPASRPRSRPEAPPSLLERRVPRSALRPPGRRRGPFRRRLESAACALRRPPGRSDAARCPCAAGRRAASSLSFWRTRVSISDSRRSISRSRRSASSSAASAFS